MAGRLRVGSFHPMVVLLRDPDLRLDLLLQHRDPAGRGAPDHELLGYDDRVGVHHPADSRGHHGPELRPVRPGLCPLHRPLPLTLLGHHLDHRVLLHAGRVAPPPSGSYLMENGKDVGLDRRPLAQIPSLFLAALLLLGGSTLQPAAAHAGDPQKDRAEELAFEASQYWDRNDYAGAIAKYRESLALDPRGETYRNLGDLYAERDMHPDAITAYQAAIAADPRLEPELRVPLGKQMIWGDRAKDAVPFLVSALADRPDDVEAQRHLALSYRWSDRLEESEAVYRKTLAGNPSDLEARKGLAAALLWQGRFLAAADEFARVLRSSPSDAEALTGLSRAQLFLDMPEESGLSVARAERAAPWDQEVRDQVERVRERLARYAVLEVRGSHDSDDLSLYEVTLSAHGRPAKGLDLDGAVRQRFFRQGSPGKQRNIGEEDAADGTGGSLSIAFRRSPAIEWHGAVGYDRYDLGGFHPWSGRFGVKITPADTVRVDLDWEHGHFDSLLSFQNKVTFDIVSLSVSKHFLWRTEVTASAALLYHHNENETGQSRENRA